MITCSNEVQRLKTPDRHCSLVMSAVFDEVCVEYISSCISEGSVVTICDGTKLITSKVALQLDLDF
jgi:hypothetical protein